MIRQHLPYWLGPLANSKMSHTTWPEQFRIAAKWFWHPGHRTPAHWLELWTNIGYLATGRERPLTPEELDALSDRIAFEEIMDP